LHQQQEDFIPSKPTVTGAPGALGESNQNEFPNTIPWPQYNFSTAGETETQKVSVLIQSYNRNFSRGNLGQNDFAKRGEESTRMTKIRSILQFVFLEFPCLNGGDTFPANILPKRNSIGVFTTKKYCMHSCSYLDLWRIRPSQVTEIL